MLSRQVRVAARFVQALRLRLRVSTLFAHLDGRGIAAKINCQYRERHKAHRWSTAFSIVDRRVGLDALRALPRGRDRDGNVWYDDKWEEDGRGAVLHLVMENARANLAPGGAYAEEGYEPDDPRRLPNCPNIPVSKHVLGIAIDADVDWEKLGGPWSDLAQRTLSNFGLVRPIASEHWHMELDPRFPWRGVSLSEAATCTRLLYRYGIRFIHRLLGRLE